MKALEKIKLGKATGPSKAIVEMRAASGEIVFKVAMGLCQRVLGDREMLDEWNTSVIVPIFKGKGDAISYGSYRGERLVGHAMKILERVLKRRM